VTEPNEHIAPGQLEVEAIGVSTRPIAEPDRRPTCVGVHQPELLLRPTNTVGVDVDLEFDSLRVHASECVLPDRLAR